MEELYNLIKLFLLGTVNNMLTEYKTSSGDNIPLFTADNIHFGTIDPFKNPTQKLICSIYPNTQSNEFNDISDVQTVSNFTITVVSKGELYEKLLSHSCRYSNTIVDALAKNYTLETVVTDEEENETTYSVDNSEIGDRTFYPDAGIAEKQATAVEIELTIYQNSQIGD